MAVKKSVKKTVPRKKKLSARRAQRGTVGNFFVFGVLALLMVVGIAAVGGLPSQNAPTTGEVVNVVTPTPGTSHDNLQLKWFGYVTLAPTPTPAKSSLCNKGGANDEPQILVGYSPGPGQAVGNTGQIKVWVNDEGSPFISSGEQVNLTTGQVTQHGNTSQKAPDNYLWEPALYVGVPVEQGGTPHFPDIIKGDFNNNPPYTGRGQKGAPIDPIPAGSNPIGPNPNGFAPNLYTAEYIWNVAGLGLTTGSYQAQFVIHDGDDNRGFGCVSIQIQ